MTPRPKRIALLALATMLLAGLAAYTPDLPAAELEQKYCDAHPRFAEIDGLRLHYRDEGSGPALLLAHGSNAALQTWDGWTDIPAEDFRGIALALTGTCSRPAKARKSAKGAQARRFPLG